MGGAAGQQGKASTKPGQAWEDEARCPPGPREQGPGPQLTEEVVQDEPVEQVLLQAADHDVLGLELGVDPLHQHLQPPGDRSLGALSTWPLTWLSTPSLILECSPPTCPLPLILQGQLKSHLLREARPDLSG